MPEVEERLFKAEALVKFGVPHKQNAWLLPQPAERKQQLVLLLHQSAGRVHTGAAQSAGGTSASALAPSLDLPAARQSSPALPAALTRMIRRPGSHSAAGSSDGVGRTRGPDPDAASLSRPHGATASRRRGPHCLLFLQQVSKWRPVYGCASVPALKLPAPRSNANTAG